MKMILDIIDEIGRIRARASLLELALVHSPGEASEDCYRNAIAQQSADVVANLDALMQSMRTMIEGAEPK